MFSFQSSNSALYLFNTETRLNVTAKSIKIRSISSSKPNIHRSTNICWYVFFPCSSRPKDKLQFSNALVYIFLLFPFSLTYFYVQFFMPPHTHMWRERESLLKATKKTNKHNPHFMGNLLRCIEHYSHPHINRGK